MFIPVDLNQSKNINFKMSIHIPIAKPPFTKLGKSIESACRKALYDFEMLESVKNLVIALSGGKDSLTMLYMLSAINGLGFPKINLHAVHVAGEYSCGAGVDQNFLRAICKELDIPLIVRNSNQSKENLNCYNCSRDRRKILFDAAKEVGACTVAFGHHRDDSIQTLLMNLFHKGEFAANLAKIKMVDYKIKIIRPLIYISEKDILNFAKLHKFLKITCQCPIGQNSVRKKTELILRDLEMQFPNIRKNLFHASLIYGSNKAEKA